MQYTYRPHLFSKGVTWSLEGDALTQIREGRAGRTIDLHAIRKLQQYSAGNYVDENRDPVRDTTCRLFHGGWPVMLRSTSFVQIGGRTGPVVKDQNAEFKPFYRQLLEQLESINPDLPVEQGDRGYSWMFIVIGVLSLVMFAVLGYFIVASGKGDLGTRLIFGPLTGVVGILSCYLCSKGARSYWPYRKTLRDVLSTL